MSESRRKEFRSKVADLPESTRLIGTISVDSSGRNIYLAVQHAANSWDLLALDTRTGEYSKIIDTKFRAGLCQVHPSISGLIMYRWETGGDSEQRMWIVNANGQGSGLFYASHP